MYQSITGFGFLLSTLIYFRFLLKFGSSKARKGPFIPCKPTSIRNKPIMMPSFHDYFYRWLPYTYYSTSSGFAPPTQEQDESRSFTPKTTENFASLLGYLKRKSLFPQPRDVSHARSFAEGLFQGRACPVQPFQGELIPGSMKEVANPCLSHRINRDLTVLSPLDTSN